MWVVGLGLWVSGCLPSFYRERKGYDVRLTIAQPRDHLRGVLAQFDTKRDSEPLRKLLAKEIMQSKSMPAIFIIRLRS